MLVTREPRQSFLGGIRVLGTLLQCIRDLGVSERIAERRELLRHSGHLFCHEFWFTQFPHSGHEMPQTQCFSDYQFCPGLLLPFRRTAAAVTLSWRSSDSDDCIESDAIDELTKKIKKVSKTPKYLRDQHFLPIRASSTTFEHRALHPVRFLHQLLLYYFTYGTAPSPIVHDRFFII